MGSLSFSLASWVMQVVNESKVAVLVNDHIGPYFNISRGVWQGGPISPILFNDVLNTLIRKSKENGLIKKLVSDLIKDGAVMLQYVDDSLHL
jgi:retron-type reverse transcriptase